MRSMVLSDCKRVKRKTFSIERVSEERGHYHSGYKLLAIAEYAPPFHYKQYSGVANWKYLTRITL